MAPLSAELWTVIALVAALVVLASLYALAVLYREQTRLHEFKNRVTILRRQYAKRMAEMEAQSMEGADYVYVDPAAAVPRRAAA